MDRERERGRDDTLSFPYLRTLCITESIHRDDEDEDKDQWRNQKNVGGPAKPAHGPTYKRTKDRKFLMITKDTKANVFRLSRPAAHH